ncbi:MAG: hypothetical protein HY056_01655 [Proteobacteria bacterium]|nr:hypothetical protein [Pseudomonadota bacterium]
MRWLNLIVILVLVSAAAYVYKVKFDATQQIERVAKLRAEIGKERDAIAALRAQWAALDNPARIQGLAERHLALRPIAATQIDTFERLPERPAPEPGTSAPENDIGALIENSFAEFPTGSIPQAADAR